MQAFALQVQTARNHVRKRILRGELDVGAQVDEHDVREKTRVSFRAVRAALTDLANEGFLIRKRRLGTIVAPQTEPVDHYNRQRITHVAVYSSLMQSDLFEGNFTSNLIMGLKASMQPPADLTYWSPTPEADHSIHAPPSIIPYEQLSGVQGIVCVETYNWRLLNELTRLGYLVAAIDYNPLELHADSVSIDFFQAGYLATSYLLRLGHKRIAFIGEGSHRERSDPTWQRRLQGYLYAMSANGDQVCRQWILDVGRSSQYIDHHLLDFHTTHRPTAYVLCTGGMIGYFRDSLKLLGDATASRISYASADNEAPISVRGAVSHVVMDYQQLGQTAIQILAARMACRSMPPVQVLRPVTFRPASTTFPPGETYPGPG